MTHSIRFFVQPRFGQVELNFREMDRAAIIGPPNLTAVRFPTLELLREHVLSANLPASICSLGDHDPIDVTRDQLRKLGFKME